MRFKMNLLNKRLITFIVIITLAAAIFAALYVTGNGDFSRFYSKNNSQQQKSKDEDKNNKSEETNEQKSQSQDQTDKEEVKKQFKDIKVRALYITGATIGEKRNLEHIIELAKTTEINSIVLDIKDDGKVFYDSAIPEVSQYKAGNVLYNVDEVLKTLHDNNIYVIGRITCFKDPVLATKRADLAIKRPNGRLWLENGRTPWASPYNEEVWKYNIDIAKEAVDKGFDEIQFDYVRFPAAKKSEVFYGKDIPSKSDAINRFLESAQKEIHDGKGVPFSADVFGIICESPSDFENIGQDLEKVGKNIDYICPMVYPSHYANAKQNGSGQTINGVLFRAPDLEPYKVVYNSLVKAKDRISKVEGYKAKVRPYLQDFTASWLPKGYYQSYGAEQVRQQIKAVYDAGYDEWILWDAVNTYSEGALEKKKE